MVAILKPFGARVAVLDPPRERIRDSGLIIISHDFDVDQGIVIELPPPHSMLSEILDGLARGLLIYYVKGTGVRIGDTTMVPMDQIIAIEE